MQGAGGIGGLMCSVDNAGNTLYYLYDANGNVGQLADEKGGIAAHYEYDPFGNQIAAGPEAEDNPFRFSTKYYDAETGLIYYGFRYYSPELGRWTGHDPLEEQGGLNLYVFVLNNPCDLYDILGREVPVGDESWWNTDGQLSSASELADLFDQHYSEAVQFFNQTVENNPSCQVWVTAAVLKTSMDLGKGMIDTLRFGEGFAEGGLGGYAKDVLRGFGLVLSSYGSITKVGKHLKNFGFQKEIRNISQKGGNSLWDSRPPGIQVRKIGNYWVKRVDPDANRLMQSWGRVTIRAQEKALAKLHQAGSPAARFHRLCKGSLAVEDVSPTLTKKAFLDKNYWRALWRDSKAIGFPNDLKPHNYGAGYRPFDPAIDPVTLGIATGGGILVTKGIFFGISFLE